MSKKERQCITKMGAVEMKRQATCRKISNLEWGIQKLEEEKDTEQDQILRLMDKGTSDTNTKRKKKRK